MIELTFLKELILTKTSTSRERNICLHWFKGLNFNHIFATDVMVVNGVC